MHLKKGIVALEVMILIIIILAIFSIAAPIFLQTHPVNRANITYKKLINIKKAIVGDSSIMVERKRASFGFVGDIGILPTDKNELLTNIAGRPTYQKAAGIDMYWGWRGPYLKDAADLIDAWGDDIVLNTVNQVDPNNGRTRIMEIRSNNLDASQIVYIYRDEAFNFATVRIVNRVRPHLPITTQNASLDIFYPNGASVTQSNFSITNGLYSTQTANLRIPVGHRYFQLDSGAQEKIATLNGGGASVVDFVTLTTAPAAPSFELTFDSTDNTANNVFNSIMTPTGGSWIDENGSLVANGGTGEYRSAFGLAGWTDYRVEVDATLTDPRGYGIYYRCDGQSNISGYCFQYDPGLGSGTYPMAFVVRKVFNGGEQAPFQQVNLTAAQFPNIYNTSHHISISVQGTRHMIRVDGALIMDFTDNSFASGMVGFRSWDGNKYTQFHHVSVYGIPPLTTGEIAWWSFEEGNNSTLGNRVFGSGFLNDPAVVENNGTFGAGVTQVSPGIFGQSLNFNGSGQVTIPNASNLNPANQVTIEAWVRTTNDRKDTNIVFKGTVGGRGNGIYQNISNSPANGGWNAQIQTTTGVTFLCWGLTRPVENTWYHVVVTYDGANMRFYTDGVQRSSIAKTGLLVSNADSLIIGNGFEGRIDEVVIYSRALTAGEVFIRFNKYRNNM